MNHINEYKEFKKPKSDRSKRISVSKIIIRDLCQKLNLDVNNIEFLASGYYGNAYKVGDKVLKITTDKDEAKSVYELIKNKTINSGIVKYYSVNMYKIKKDYVYIILMEYVTPLTMFLSKKYGINYYNEYKLIDKILDIICNKWGKLKSKNELINLIEEFYITEHKTVSFFIEKIWELYKNLEFLEEYPDLHNENIGIKNGKFVYFDYAMAKKVRKFNEPSIF